MATKNACSRSVRISDYEIMKIGSWGYRKLSSDRHTDRQTDSTKIIYHAALLVVNKDESRSRCFTTVLRWPSVLLMISCSNSVGCS